MARPTHEALALRCRAQYMRWLLQYLLDHPDGYAVGEATMRALQAMSDATVGDVAIDAYTAGWYDRGDIRKPEDFDEAEPALRGIWQHLKEGA
jgi:hypothetical protein